MKPFDERWRTTVERARQAPARDETAPFGFAQRVVARVRSASSPAPEATWERMAWRWLAGVALLLALSAALEVPHLRSANPFAPGVQNAVAQLAWTL